MKLFRTEYEVVISAPQSELAGISAEIIAAPPGRCINFPVSDRYDENAALGQELAVTITDGKFCAKWNNGVVLITGGKDQVQGFAEALMFDSGTPSGCHTHWEHYAWSEGIDSSSIPIVIEVA